jgi:predicted nucleic acid-binding protein
VRIVIADTGPIHYLVLIGHEAILGQLFEKILLPSVVRAELTHPATPPSVRRWMDNPPAWLEIVPVAVSAGGDPSLQFLDDGERAAIVLATSLRADLILMDDREGASAARQKGFAVTGTIGILDLAARRGMLRLSEAFALLKNTNFRYPQEIMDALPAQHEKKADE